MIPSEYWSIRMTVWMFPLTMIDVQRLSRAQRENYQQQRLLLTGHDDSQIRARHYM